jgi:hypothetical protein
VVTWLREKTTEVVVVTKPVAFEQIPVAFGQIAGGLIVLRLWWLVGANPRSSIKPGGE